MRNGFNERMLDMACVQVLYPYFAYRICYSDQRTHSPDIVINHRLITQFENEQKELPPFLMYTEILIESGIIYTCKIIEKKCIFIIIHKSNGVGGCGLFAKPME